jgi:hypothetical protein
MNASALRKFWDVVVNAFLDGGPSYPQQLEPWFKAYRGRDRGAVMEDALPEPWLGDLTKPAKAVFLQLNPGLAVDYQTRSGIFAGEIAQAGGYSEWTASWPYQHVRDGTPDPILVGTGESMLAAQFWRQASAFGNVRLRFAQNWFRDPSLTFEDVLMFELYPWHSRGVKGTLQPPIEFVREYVWESIVDVGARYVFAFGAPWFTLLPRLDMEFLPELNAANGLGSTVPSRAVLFGKVRGTKTVVVAEKHSGSAGPPRKSEVDLIRAAYEGVASDLL